MMLAKEKPPADAGTSARGAVANHHTRTLKLYQTFLFFTRGYFDG